MRIVVQVRELVSSNVSSLVETASSPVKMLRHLRKEIEEADIALHGEISKLERQQERAEDAAAKSLADAEDWSGKARTAMDHEREDLARSALLAREDCKLAAEKHKTEAARLGEEASEARDALEQLAGKLAETNAKLREVEAEQIAVSQSPGRAGADSRSDKTMDRIAELERRVSFTEEAKQSSAPSHAQLEDEIASMRREANVDAELEKLRRAGKPKAGKRTVSKKSKAG